MARAGEFLHVTIRARDGIRFQGDAKSVSSINQKGTFDILPEHANFICTIEKRVWVQTKEGKQEEFSLENGVLHVSEDNVVVYLEIK